MQKMKERAFRRIITAHDGVITSAVDLIGDRKYGQNEMEKARREDFQRRF